ncbi:MAG: TetR/AcrR family transcriptional regulator [Acidimicrobiales bacterium]
MSRQEERKADTRARLIAAAAELFAAKGFHAVSAEAVADAAGRTTGALYAHFGGKDGLLLALVEAWLDESATRIESRVELAHDLDGRLLSVWRSFSSPPAEHGDSWLLLEFELFLHGARDIAFAHKLAERYADYRLRLAGAIDLWARDEGLGGLRHPDHVAAHTIALLLGMAMQHRVDPAAITDDIVVAGMRAVIDPDRAAAAGAAMGEAEIGRDREDRPDRAAAAGAAMGEAEIGRDREDRIDPERSCI